jgi:hypothetical protein
MPNLSSEISAFEAMRARLETDHLGEWVVVHDEKLVGLYPTMESAAIEAVKRFGNGPYLIRQIGAPAVVLPASVMYRASHDSHDQMRL